MLTVSVLGACTSHTTAVSLHTTGGSLTPSATTDVASANAVMLATGDVPGFVASPQASADPTTLQAATSFGSCSGASALLGGDGAVAMSPAYFKDKNSAVASLAFVAPTFAAAQTAIAELSRADLGGCLTGLFRTVLGLDVVPGTTAVTSLAPAANVGDQSAMWQTTIQVTSGGQTVAAYADLTFFRSGRTVATLFDFQLGSPFPAANRNQLLAAMAARAG